MLERVEEAFGLTMAAVNIVDDGRITVFAGRDARRDAVERYQGIAIDSDLPGPAAIAANEPLLLNSSADIERRFPHIVDMVADHGIDSLLALPIRSPRREALGALVVGRAVGNAFALSDLALLHDLADKTGSALDRARLYDRLVVAHEDQRAVAIRLQESLLPDTVVRHPSVEIQAQYRAADDVMQVGGDWYDTFCWESGHVAVMVGDVVGHDPEAAARMGRLRAATAALIPVGPAEPVAILQSLDRCARGPDGVDFVTAAVVVLDTATGELACATAGHPPPIVVRKDGAVQLLDCVRVPPLGNSLVVEWPTGPSTHLSSGDTVVVYSDGAVERRGSSITDGIATLGDRCSELRTLALGDLVEQVITPAGDDNADDDVVVAMMRWLGAR